MNRTNLGNYSPAVSNAQLLVPQPLVIIPVLRSFRRHCQAGVLFGFRQGLDDLRCLAQSLHVTLPTQKVTHSRRFVLLTFCGVKTPVVRRKITGLVAGLPPHANAWTEGCLTHHGVCCRRPINLPMLFSGPCPRGGHAVEPQAMV